MMTVLEFLKEARGKVDKEGAWIRGSNALNSERAQVQPDDEDACHFCMWGALQSIDAAMHVIGLAENMVMDACLEATGGESPVIREWHQKTYSFDVITDFNDEVADDVGQVLEVFDRAIEQVSREEVQT